MGPNQHKRLAMIAVALVAVLAVGMLSIGTGVASVGGVNDTLSAFAQNGNGNGNGNNGEGNGNGNNGQGQENGNPPADPGNGNNGQGQGEDDSAAAPEEPAGEDEVQAQDEGQASEKVDICHVTGSGEAHLINVSENAVPAHEGHGDTIDVASEEACDEIAQAEPTDPDGTPAPDDDDDIATPGVATPDVGTPIASPVS